MHPRSGRAFTCNIRHKWVSEHALQFLASPDRAKAEQRPGACLPRCAIEAIPAHMFEAFMLFAASAAAPQGLAQPSGREQGSCAILDNTYNAFVAVEESPDLREIVRPAIVTRIGDQPAIAAPSGADWIS